MSILKERLTFSVDAAIKDGLEKHVPKNRRSAFAEKALAEALEKLVRERAIEALNALAPVANLQRVQSEDVLRDIRKAQGTHLTENNPKQ